MIDTTRLRVSLTKNGYLKLAHVIRRHPSWEVLDNVYGKYRGVNLQRSQVANILGADANAGQVPEIWDDIRALGDQVIDAMTFVAIVFSHERLIESFRDGADENFRGSVTRIAKLSSKEYTNLVYALASLGLSEYEPNANRTDYDLYPLVATLASSASLVRRLISLKLAKCGWLDPSTRPGAPDGDFLSECRRLALHRVFAMEWEQFVAWMAGGLIVDERPVEFGLSANHLPCRPR